MSLDMDLNDQANVAGILDNVTQAVLWFRRSLVVIVTIGCVGWFNLYVWYFSWGQAKIVGRAAVVDVLKERENSAQDAELLEKMRRELERLEEARLLERLDAPLLGIKVVREDLSVAVLLSSIAALLWLWFNQIHLRRRLKVLAKLEGTAQSRRVLSSGLGPFGGAEGKSLTLAKRFLVWLLPLLAVSTLASDVYDLCSMLKLDHVRWAMMNSVYRNLVYARLLFVGGLTILIVIVGWRNVGEWKKMEGLMLLIGNGKGQAERTLKGGCGNFVAMSAYNRVKGLVVAIRIVTWQRWPTSMPKRSTKAQAQTETAGRST